MKIFLFDDNKKLWPEDYGFLSRYINARSWDHAEQLAEEQNVKLVGAFIKFINEETGEVEYLH